LGEIEEALLDVNPVVVKQAALGIAKGFD